VTRFSLDRPWGSVVEAKVNIASRLKKELAKGVEGVVGVGTVTDPYQPVEAELELTRGCLSILRRYGARISILTKSDLVLRDLEVLRGWEGAEVGLSVACVDDQLAAVVEPGASPPSKRLSTLEELSEAGVDVYMMAAPVIPGYSDSEDLLRALVQKAKQHRISRIMWDMFNPKPIAADRLGKRIGAGHPLETRSSLSDASERCRAILAKSCREEGIELVDAF
jgi:DNA repair photolyase